MDRISSSTIPLQQPLFNKSESSFELSKEDEAAIMDAHARVFFKDPNAYRQLIEKELPPEEKKALYCATENATESSYVYYNSTRVAFPRVTTRILASWILPNEFEKKLVVTQAPLREHIEYFWTTMSNIGPTGVTIVMLCHLKEENNHWFKYWPEKGVQQGITYTLKINKVTRESDFMHRTMALERSKSILDKAKIIPVEHYHFDNWADATNDISIQALGDLIYKLAFIDTTLVIHCKAGLNRSSVVTAAYIAVKKIIKDYHSDVSLLNAESDRHKFMRDILIKLRDSKEGRSPQMLGDVYHYVLLHILVSYICKEHFKQEWKHFPLK